MESTGVLGNDIEVSAERAECSAVKGVGMRDAIYFGAGRVNCMVDHIC